MIIAVDPGVHKCGIAHFNSGSDRLVGAFYSSWEDLNPGLINTVDRLVIEMPRVYPGMPGIDLNDLLNLAAMVGRFEAIFPSHIRVFPSQWKGQVPKAVMNNRVLNKLSIAERVVVDSADVIRSKRHNMLDAVGIGLYHLGRL